jgi:hypothetical protein
MILGRVMNVSLLSGGVPRRARCSTGTLRAQG